MKSSGIIHKGKLMLRTHPKASFSFISVGALLAVSTLFLLSLYSPQRIISKINRTVPRIANQLEQHVHFSLIPKEVVPMFSNPTVAPLRPGQVHVFNGPLFVDPQNPRYFTDNSGKAIYLSGSHTWSNLQDNGGSDPPPVFNYPAYLDFLVANHHNFFRLWTWEQTRWTLETADDNYWFNPTPYQRTGPGNALDGKPKFDLSQFNQAYFDRLRERVIAAGDRGIYVSIMLFDGWSIESAKGQYSLNNPWHGHPFNSNNNINGINGDPNNNDSGEEVHQGSIPEIVTLQQAYVRKVIDTVNDLDNVLYEIANESNNNSEPWQYDMINFIHGYEASKPKQHPVGMTSAWPGGWNPDLFSSPAEWISLNNPDGTYMNNPPVADGTKVSIFDTDHLCGICGNRQWVWKSFTRGHNPIFMDGYDGAAYGVGGVGFNFNDPTWVSLRKNLGYTLSYADRLDLNNVTPHGNLASSGYCLANPGLQNAEYLVYVPAGGNVTVDLSATPGILVVEWLNPETGDVYTGSTANGGGAREFQVPFNGDAVLYLYSGTAGATLTPTPTGATQTPTPTPTGSTFTPTPVGAATRTPSLTDISTLIATLGNNLYIPYILKGAVQPAPSATPTPTLAYGHPGTFLDTFDGNPATPQPFFSSEWDVSVHSRDLGTWYQLDSMLAAHSPNCEPPPATHTIDQYADAVFVCHDHVMTAINGEGYAEIMLAPDHLVDFSNGEAVIQFDMSTLRSSDRDWVDLWITPFDQNVALPIDLDVDLQGSPRNAVHLRMDFGYSGKFSGAIYRDFISQAIPLATTMGYETVLTPSATLRSTFQLTISANHIKFGMPSYNLWWIDTFIPTLNWDRGVLQIGHHSYNPTKDCAGSDQPCAPNTWHFDNVSINPSIAFMMIKGDHRYVSKDGTDLERTMTFASPAPVNSYLRFSGIGVIEVSFDGGSFQPATKAASSELLGYGIYHPEHFSSYWVAMPQGTTSVTFQFSSDGWYTTSYEMIAKDITIWSLTR